MFGLSSPLLQLGQSVHIFLPNLSGIHQAEAVIVFAFLLKQEGKMALHLKVKVRAMFKMGPFSVCSYMDNRGMNRGAAILSSTYKVACL